MTLDLPNKPQHYSKAKDRTRRELDFVEQLLSEIALVLKMTQKVRHEMDAEQEADELVLA